MWKSNKFIRNWIILLIAQVVVIGLITWLYIIDHNATNLNILREFINNEIGVCYSDNANDIHASVDSDSISGIVNNYDLIRFNMELCLMMDTDKQTVMSYEDATEAMQRILPDSIGNADSAIMPFIYTNTINDVRTLVNKNCENYYEIEYKLMLDLSLHQPYLNNNFKLMLYRDITKITFYLTVVLIFLLALGCVNVLTYVAVFILRIKRIKSNGA